MKKGLSPEKAIKETLLSAGRSIAFTALTLGASFSALIFSKFVPIMTLGTFLVFTVFIVGVASITILPVVCITFIRKPFLNRSEKLKNSVKSLNTINSLLALDLSRRIN